MTFYTVSQADVRVWGMFLDHIKLIRGAGPIGGWLYSRASKWAGVGCRMGYPQRSRSGQPPRPEISEFRRIVKVSGGYMCMAWAQVIIEHGIRVDQASWSTLSGVYTPYPGGQAKYGLFWCFGSYFVGIWTWGCKCEVLAYRVHSDIFNPTIFPCKKQKTSSFHQKDSTEFI